MENVIDIKEITEDLSEREKKFVIHSATNPEDSASEAARQSGVSDISARFRGSEMSKKPEVQQAIADLREKIGDTDNLDIRQLVKDKLLDIAMQDKGSDRDVLNALQLLGKTEAMFVDVQETKDVTDDSKLLDQIEQEFGKDARNKAEEEMGIDATEEG